MSAHDTRVQRAVDVLMATGEVGALEAISTYLDIVENLHHESVEELSERGYTPAAAQQRTIARHYYHLSDRFDGAAVSIERLLGQPVSKLRVIKNKRRR